MRGPAPVAQQLYEETAGQPEGSANRPPSSAAWRPSPRIRSSRAAPPSAAGANSTTCSAAGATAGARRWTGTKAAERTRYGSCLGLSLCSPGHRSWCTAAASQVNPELFPMKLKHLLAALVAATALAGAAQAQQFFRIGTGGTAGTYYPVGGMIANAVSQPGKIIATAQASNGSLANVNARRRRLAGSGLLAVRRRHLGLHRHRRLRRQAEGHRPAHDRQPVPRKHPPGREEGLGHQDRGRPQGQARRAGRAGLGHAGRCAPGAGRLRREGIGHQARVHQAQPGRRQAQGRRARRVLLRRRRPGRRHRRAGLHRRRHRAAAARPARRPTRCASPAPSSPSTTSPPAPTRTCPPCRRWPSAPSWVTSAKVDAETVYQITKAHVQRRRRRRRWQRATPRASSSPRKTPSRASASRSTRAPRSSTRKPAC